MIVGLLSWFDERADHLGELVRSLAPFVDHLIAVDGPYALYPARSAGSPAVQAEVLRGATRAAGMGLTLVEPVVPWAGGEVEKRSLMFRVAEAVTTPTDWLFVIDGDEIVTDIGLDVHGTLGRTEFDVGTVSGWQVNGPGRSPMRRFFRAQRGLTVVGTHCTYMAGDECLWGPGQVPAVEMAELMVQHRKDARDVSRQQGATEYYRRRDVLGIERPAA